MKTLTRFAREHRRNRTPAEKQFRRVLLRAGLKFRTERTIDRFIVDVLIPERWLVIEIDGGYHAFQKEKDLRRDEYLREKGYAVLRFSNEDVFNRPEFIVDSITRIPKKEAPEDYRKLYGVAAY